MFRMGFIFDKIEEVFQINPFKIRNVCRKNDNKIILSI